MVTLTPVVPPAAAPTQAAAKETPRQKRRPLGLTELSGDEQFVPEFAQTASAPLFPVIEPAMEEYPEEPLSPPAPIDDNPFGVLVAETLPEARKFLERPNKIEFSSSELAQVVQSNAEKRDINFDARRARQQQNDYQNPFIQTLGNMKPAPSTLAPTPRVGVKATNEKPTTPERDLSQLAPRELRHEFERTFLSENQFLSPMETPSMPSTSANGNKREIVELSSGSMMAGGRKVLQMRLEFGPDSAAVTSESVNIIRSFSQVATADPSNAIEIAISDKVMEDENQRRLAARRFAIVSNIMRGAGVAERQILPKLATSEENSFVFSVVDSEIYTATTRQSDAFGDEVRVRSFDVRRW
jgi:outer membrane protein OmpA-like peptidoglycan-associated protein